jgi:hypothetical protein
LEEFNSENYLKNLVIKVSKISFSKLRVLVLVMFQRFLDAADYWFGYSDDSSAGSYDPARECFVVVVDDQAGGANAAGAGDGEVPRNPRASAPQNPRPSAPPTSPTRGADINAQLAQARELEDKLAEEYHAVPSAPPTSPTRGADINAQLAQARELEDKLAEEYHAVRLLHASIAREASVRGERGRELGKQARERINADFDINNPNTPPRASQKLIAASTLLRAMAAPSMPEVQNLHREAQALIEEAAVQQAESSASRIRQQGSAQDDRGAWGPEASVHTGGVMGQPAN